MNDLEARLARLNRDQRIALADLMRRQRLDRGVVNAPTSVFQQGMWFLEQVRPQNAAYAVSTAARIVGKLDVARLRQCATALVDRHDALRTTFEMRDNRPVQVVHPAMAVDVFDVDARGRAAEIDTLVSEHAVPRPLDIEHGPLFYVSLLHLADEDAILIITIHHIISDRWSLTLLLDELRRLYEAGGDDPLGTLGAPPLQYPEFARWQRKQQQDGSWAVGLARWVETLRGAPQSLDLPLDRPRPRVQSFRGAQVPVSFDRDFMAGVAATAARLRATPYMVMLAAYAVLWQVHARQDTVVVAVPTTVRSRPELETCVGYFVNTLPIRVELSGEPTFAEVVDRVHRASVAAHALADIPFDLIVADIHGVPDLSRPPVAQVSFSYGRDPAVGMPFGEAVVTRLPVSTGGARFDIELQGFETDGAFTGWFEYNTDLFDTTTIERLAEQFAQLLSAAVENPNQRVVELRLADPHDVQDFLRATNDTARTWPERHGWIHEDIAAQAMRTPTAEALWFEGATMTYAELDAAADRLAERLSRLGAGPNTTVAVCLERSLELVVGLLAVLKAGAAFLPLDPTHPPRRLQAILDSARPVATMVRGLGPSNLPAGDAARLDLTEAASEPAARPVAPTVALAPEDMAYVLFTSGSTGTPKGVVNTHAGIRNRLLWMQDRFPLDHHDAVLQKTVMTFDVSLWEFFWPLMVGARLVIASPGGHRDPAYLHRLMAEQQITVCHFVPSMLRAFLAQPIEQLTSLRYVFCSGEALPADAINEFLARSPSELHNLYGPTEAAIDVTHWPCTPIEQGRPVPIGRPVANTEVWVRDASGRDLPPGVAGELWLGGVQVAAGYLGRPDLTAGRFVAAPGGLGRRQFRTGDLARFLPDGTLQFLGRLDDQVKLRGLRIEPGEIEAALTDQPAVSAARVVAEDIGPGNTQLWAYVVPAAGAAVDPVALKAVAAQSLPEYMVPSVILAVDDFPLTASGKLDRKRLPRPENLPDQVRPPHVPPRSDVERQLSEIWAELLGTPQVGVHDNFFDLGGHSLLIAQAQARVQADLGVEISVIDLFRYPTIAALSGHLSGTGPAPTSVTDDARERAATRRGARARTSAGRSRTAAVPEGL